LLVITIDSTVVGRRERELRDGMNEMPRGDLISKLPFMPQLFARPVWLARFLLGGGLPTMPNIVVPGKGALQVRDAHTALIRGTFFWKDMNWIRDHWKGPIVIKGVLTAEDARRSLDHGPRQLSSQTMALASSTSSRQRCACYPRSRCSERES
jgi:isopentenyl diphosphate isomerase/L-lactate dehydrogenase-like FMN-dependent dehydrogenase